MSEREELTEEYLFFSNLLLDFGGQAETQIRAIHHMKQMSGLIWTYPHRHFLWLFKSTKKNTIKECATEITERLINEKKSLENRWKHLSPIGESCG